MGGSFDSAEAATFGAGQPARPIRVGFLGAGLIATFHSKMLRLAGLDADGTIVRAGVYDIDRARAEAFAAASGHVVADSEAEVVAAADAVYICTWTSEHERLVDLAVEHGCAVFCEKPLAPDLPGAARIAARLEGTIHQVGLVLRRSPAMRALWLLAHEASAGPIQAIVFRDDQFIPIQGHYASTWRGDPVKAGAGTLLEHSIHDVDLLLDLAGPVHSVSAAQSFLHGIDGIEDTVAAALQFDSGALGTLTSVWHDHLGRPSLRRVEIFCQRRYIHLGGNGDGTDWWGPVQWSDTEGGQFELSGPDLASWVLARSTGLPAPQGMLLGRSRGSDVVDTPVRTAQHRQFNPDAAFIHSVLAGQPAWPTAHDALKAHEVVDALYRAARAQRVRVSHR